MSAPRCFHAWIAKDLVRQRERFDVVECVAVQAVQRTFVGRKVVEAFELVLTRASYDVIDQFVDVK